jgi:hypothetical protein
MQKENPNLENICNKIERKESSKLNTAILIKRGLFMELSDWKRQPMMRWSHLHDQ